jgi:hypothetical protein
MEATDGMLRVDERYDNDNPADGIDSSDPWRTLESSTHGPGLKKNGDSHLFP